MLVSQSINDYSMSATSTKSASETSGVRIRTLHVCEPSYPPRDIVRRENYARRKAQELHGWGCPRNVPYQGIDPEHLPSETSKITIDSPSASASPIKPSSKLSTIESRYSQRNLSAHIHEENTAKTQYETAMRRLQTAHSKHMKKSSDILKSVQLGHNITEVIGKSASRTNHRAESVDHHGSTNVTFDDKESDVLYDRLVDDFEEDDDGDASSISDIRDDIMSPRTVTNTNITSTCAVETPDFLKCYPPEISLMPMKLCQSAPPLNRNNIRQATLRPFTPRYSGISARLRITRHMPFRDQLYRQLCCILWLLRSMGRQDWSEMLSGCWNIEQWLRNDSRSPSHHRHQHNHEQTKKQNESIKTHQTKTNLFETKLPSTNLSKENSIAALRTAGAAAAATAAATATHGHTDHLKKKHSVTELSIPRLSEEDISGRRSMLSDASERLDVPINTNNVEPELNESVSSRSNAGEQTESSNLDPSHLVTNLRSSAATPAVLTNNTSRTSISTNVGFSPGRGVSGRLTSIMERRRSPELLLKRWMKNQKLLNKTSNETLPLNDSQIRSLRVGDTDDLKRIFGLENTIDNTKEEVIRERRTREIERKPVPNVKRRPTTSVTEGQSKRHAQILNKIKRNFNEFTEEQSIILNNKLEQADNERFYFCQAKLRELQLNMPPLTILDRLLKQLRYDEDKKKTNVAYHKYQAWYVDLLQMVQPDYSDDPIITLLLKEMEEFGYLSAKPNVIRFKSVLTGLRAHEICHPDVMAAIEFIRIHVIRMGSEEFDKFFCKEFPTVTNYIIRQTTTANDHDVKEESKSVI